MAIPHGFWARFRHGINKFFLRTYIHLIMITCSFMCLAPICYSMVLPDVLEFTDFLYFLVVTWWTVGYGDITPDIEVMANNHVLHIGLYLLFVPWLLILPMKVIKHEFRKFIHGQKISLNISKPPGFKFLTPFIQLFLLTHSVLFFVCLSTWLVVKLEKCSWETGFYLVVTSFTTVGYGNVAFDTQHGRRFAIIWLPVSIWFYTYVSHSIFRLRFPDMCVESLKLPFPKSVEEKSLSLAHALWISVLDMDMNDTITVSSNAFGDVRNIVLWRDDIIQFLSMDEISAACISMFMRNLWESFSSGRKKHFIFVDPAFMAPYGSTLQFRKDRLAIRLLKARNRAVVIVPYNKGRHWVLLVIDMRNLTVYYLDSLLGSCDSDMKLMVDVALSDALKKGGDLLSYEAMIHNALAVALSGEKVDIKRLNQIRETDKNPLKDKKAVSWKLVQCPHQSGGVECGFFVLKFMKDIVTLNTNFLENEIQEKFEAKTTYTQEEIDMVRVEWADAVESLIE